MAPTEADMQELREAAIAADRLRTDPAFQRAILAMRKSAVERLVSVDPDDGAAIRTLQANILAIDSLCEQIATAIMRGKERTGPAVA